jgi:hypothetical protein
MEREKDITDENVLKTIQKFSNVMVNRYFKLYTGIKTDFKFDVELVDLFNGERQWDYEDEFRRNYDYVLELISDKPFPLVIHINNTKNLEKYNVRILVDNNQPYIWVANIQTMLKQDIKMLGYDLDKTSFGSTAIQIKNVDRSADFKLIPDD